MLYSKLGNPRRKAYFLQMPDYFLLSMPLSKGKAIMLPDIVDSMGEAGMMPQQVFCRKHHNPQTEHGQDYGKEKK